MVKQLRFLLMKLLKNYVQKNNCVGIYDWKCDGYGYNLCKSTKEKTLGNILVVGMRKLKNLLKRLKKLKS